MSFKRGRLIFKKKNDEENRVAQLLDDQIDLIGKKKLMKSILSVKMSSKSKLLPFD